MYSSIFSLDIFKSFLVRDKRCLDTFIGIIKKMAGMDSSGGVIDGILFRLKFLLLSEPDLLGTILEAAPQLE